MELISRGARIQIQGPPITHAFESSSFLIGEFLIPFSGIISPLSVSSMAISK